MRKKTHRSPAVGRRKWLGTRHLCCHSQFLQTAMCELLHIQLPTLVSLVCHTSTGGKGWTPLPSLYPWILSLRVCSTIILGITSTFAVRERTRRSG